MAKRYKLVPENLVRRYMQQHDVDTPSSTPASILKQTIPDDLKILLYADAARDLNLRAKRKREEPILFNSQDEQPKLKPVDRVQQSLTNQKSIGIHNFLNAHGITYNDDDEVVINGVPIPNSFYPMVIRGLQNHAIGYQPGMRQVIDALPIKPPDASKAVMVRYGPGPSDDATNTSPSTSGSKKTPRRRAGKQRGTGWTCLH